MKLAALALAFAGTLTAQTIEGISVARRQHVRFDAEPQTVAASHVTSLPLHFTIEQGFHINSHTPHSALLIPTKLAVEEDDGLKVNTVDFPRGHDYAFAASPQDKLDVYTADFTLTAHIVARPGQHTLKGVLHYQACDTASCYPPKMLPVLLEFNAR